MPVYRHGAPGGDAGGEGHEDRTGGVAGVPGGPARQGGLHGVGRAAAADVRSGDDERGCGVGVSSASGMQGRGGRGIRR